MKSAGGHRFDETAFPAPQGFRRLSLKDRCTMISTGEVPPSQQSLPNGAIDKILDNWQCTEGESGVASYLSLQNTGPPGCSKSDSTSNNCTAYLSNKGCPVSSQKIATSGYSPNRFPLPASISTGSSSAAGARSLPSLNYLQKCSSPYSKNSPVAASEDKWSSVYSNKELRYSNLAAAGGSSAYFGSPSLQSFSSNYSNGYGNVLKRLHGSDKVLSRNYAEVNKYTVKQKKERNIAGSNNNIVNYFSPPVLLRGEKKSAGVADGFRYRKDGQPVWTTSGKAYACNESKLATSLRNGSSRSSVSRSKPRMPKLFQSLCCCVRPETNSHQKRQVLQPSPLTNPSALITQVTKTSVNGTNVDGENFSGGEPYSPAEIENEECIPMQSAEKLLLPPQRLCDGHKKCLIIDLDETLVHSSFKPVKNPDFVIPVEIDNVVHQVYVLKRPFVDEFLERIGDKFECVLFTASLAKYADPVADLLDKRGVFRSRLFREACVFHKGNYVKDLTRLGRDLKKVIIVDNSPASYAFHPDNAIAVQSWFDDANDSELLGIIPLLEQLADVESIYSVLRNSNDDIRRSSSLEVQNDTSRSS